MKKQIRNVGLVCLIMQIFLQVHILSAQAAQPIDAARLKSCIDQAVSYEIQTVENPTCATIGGEWTVFALSRYGALPEGMRQNYLTNLQAVLDSCAGVLSTNKYTEYARVILALSSMNIDSKEVFSYPLLTYLSDYDKVTNQGINGAVYALLAIDTRQYDMEVRERLLAFILSQQREDGGWSLLPGRSDTDMTAMALTALAPYREQNPTVDAAVSEALVFLSDTQQEDGSYKSGGVVNVESTAQVLVALSSLQIPLTDERFVKGENTVLDALLRFQNEDGSFRHTMDGAGNAMATDQALYAMIAYYRYQNGQTSLYAMTDVKTEEKPTATMTQEEFLARCAAISEMPIIDQLGEVNLLLQELDRQGTFETKETVKNGLLAAKAYIERSQAAVEALDADIWEQIDPLRLKQGDKAKIEALRVRYNQLQKADRAYVSYAADLKNAVEVMEQLEEGIIPAFILTGLRTTGESFCFEGKSTETVTYTLQIEGGGVVTLENMSAVVKKGNTTKKDLPEGAVSFYFKESGDLPAKCELTLYGLAANGSYELYSFDAKALVKVGEYKVRKKTFSFETTKGGTYYLLPKKAKAQTAVTEPGAQKTQTAVTEPGAQKAQTTVTEQSTQKTQTTAAEQSTQKTQTPAAEQNAQKTQTPVAEQSTQKAQTTVTEPSGQKTPDAQVTVEPKKQFDREEIAALMGKNENLYYEQTEGFCYKAVVNGTDIKEAMALDLTVLPMTDETYPLAFCVPQKKLTGILYLELQTFLADGDYLLCQEGDGQVSFLKKVSVQEGILKLTIAQGGTYFVTTRLLLEDEESGEQEHKTEVFWQEAIRQNPMPALVCCVVMLTAFAVGIYGVGMLLRVRRA